MRRIGENRKNVLLVGRAIIGRSYRAANDATQVAGDAVLSPARGWW